MLLDGGMVLLVGLGKVIEVIAEVRDELRHLLAKVDVRVRARQLSPSSE